MDNGNGPSVANVQIPESEIVMTEKGPDFKAVKAADPVDSKTVQTDKDSSQDRPITPGDNAPEATSQDALKSMADKAAICMMRRVQTAIDGADWTLLDRLMPNLMKLLDAQMAMEWSIKWQRSILERPQNLSTLKGNGALTELNKGRAVKARKDQRGDQRTTAKRLLKDLPMDDVA